jgi:hypothetical protein
VKFHGVGGRRLSILVAAVTAVTLATAAVSSSAPPRTVKLDASVSGGGKLTAAGGLDCGEDCDRRYRRGAVVDVKAKPSNNETFDRWSGDCVGVAESCSVLLEEATRIRAVFVPIQRKVSTTVGGPGTVVSDPLGQSAFIGNLPGIRCGTTADLCSGLFGQGQTITLKPSPDAGAVFAGWGGACAGQPVDRAPRCELTVGANQQVANRATAWFRHRVAALGPQPLRIDADARRDIRSSPEGIVCGDVCSFPFASATTVTLSAGDVRWSGDCVGTVDSCTVVVDEPIDVAASFAQSAGSQTLGYGVKVSLSGRGSVKVGRKISCDKPMLRRSRCRGDFAPRSRFTLVASPGRRFVRWRDPYCAKRAGRRPRCSLIALDSRLIVAMFHKR